MAAAAAGPNNYHLSFPPEWQTYFDRCEVNLESHRLLWADRKFDDIQINEEKLFFTLTQFHQLVNHTKVFDHWRTCLNYIEKKDVDTFTFLICSAAYAKEIVPKLWPFEKVKVWKVYVYCAEDRQNQLEWLEHYNSKKICSVHRELDSLLVAIKKDVQEYLIHEKAVIFSDLVPTTQNSINENGCSWWQKLINVLVSLPYPENYHHQLVHEFEEHGFKNKIFEEFQSGFPSKKRAIWWYSRSGYFFGALNRAFRQQNVRIILLFGSFIQDLHRQLKSEHLKQKQQRENPITTVYRGQVLSGDDFKKLVVGFPVRCNSFFSSSTDRDMAHNFLVSSLTDRDIERVLFEIQIDYRTVCPPFADISQLSFFPRERETLFMSGTCFLLESCHQEDVNVVDGPLVRYWLVKLRLLSDYDLHRGRELETTNAPRKTVKNCVDALSEILEMVCTEDVQLVFDALVSLYPREQNWIAAIRLYCLAMLEFENNDDDYNMVVSYHKQAIAVWQEYYLHDVELNCYFNIAQSHFALGDLFGYSIENQMDLSVYHWEQALHFYELALSTCATVATDYPKVSILAKLVMVCKNLSRSGDLERYGSKAVTYQKEQMQLMLLRNPVLSTSSEIAAQFGNLADIHATVHRYDDALSNYEKAVDLYLSNDNSEVEQWTLSHNIINLCKQIVTICVEHTHDFTLALKYQLLQHKCKLKQVEDVVGGAADLLGDKARYLAESHFSVADCYTNTEQYVAAYKHLIDGLKYTRLGKELLLQNGLTLARCDDRHLLVPLTEDNYQLIDCELRIKEKEEKLRLIQPLLEKSLIQ